MPVFFVFVCATEIWNIVRRAATSRKPMRKADADEPIVGRIISERMIRLSRSGGRSFYAKMARPAPKIRESIDHLCPVEYTQFTIAFYIPNRNWC